MNALKEIEEVNEEIRELKKAEKEKVTRPSIAKKPLGGGAGPGSGANTSTASAAKRDSHHDSKMDRS